MTSSPVDLKIRAQVRSEHFWVGLCALATFFIVATVLWIVGYLVMFGGKGFQLSFIFGSGMFDGPNAGVWPMILGTVCLVFLMTIFVTPTGVIAAIYLHEYAPQEAMLTRITRLAVNNLAGIPSIIFGLFGLGFFINFIGRNIDQINGATEPVWGKPALIWAALTMAILTLPVVIVATEEALRSIPQTVRDASTGLGATKLYTIVRVIIPQAMPGILTGCILAVSRGAGEVAPIMFVGAAYSAPLPYDLGKQFMELGYHIYVLATQSPDVKQTEPLLFGTVVVLLLLTFCLNILAIVTRLILRSRYRQFASN